MATEEKKEKVCGHVNEHDFVNKKKVTCVLKPGHPGNHSDGKSEWNDAAGVPVK